MSRVRLAKDRGDDDDSGQRQESGAVKRQADAALQALDLFIARTIARGLAIGSGR